MSDWRWPPVGLWSVAGPRGKVVPLDRARCTCARQGRNADVGQPALAGANGRPVYVTKGKGPLRGESTIRGGKRRPARESRGTHTRRGKKTRKKLTKLT
ncbi:hypothetical protein MRX96_021498 [Rhipicephalus microplus]